MPDELIVPVAALPPATPFTCQVTAVFDDPATVALKDCVAPARTFALAGETVTVTLDPEGGVVGLEAGELFVVPVQPVSAAAASRSTKSGECRKANFFNLSIRKHTESKAQASGLPVVNYASPRAAELLYARTKSDTERGSSPGISRMIWDLYLATEGDCRA